MNDDQKFFLKAEISSSPGPYYLFDILPRLKFVGILARFSRNKDFEDLMRLGYVKQIKKSNKYVLTRDGRVISWALLFGEVK